MRAVVIVDDRIDRRARRPEPGAGRPVDLVAALSRIAASGDRELVVDLAGWSAVGDGPGSDPGLTGADVVHVLPGPGSHPTGLDRLLAAVPAGVPVVVSLPDRPPLPRFVGRSRQPSRRWSDRLPRTEVDPSAPGVRGVHVVTTEPVESGYVQAGVGAAGVLSATRLGPGYDAPALAHAFDLAGPVVLALTSAREAGEAVEVLRAAEALGRAGARPLVVVSGVGTDQAAAARAATFAEASGVRVKLLGRAGPRELARWRATATVAVTTDRDPGRPGDLAGLLMAGLPVAAVRNRANKAVAGRATAEPRWYDAGEPAELAAVLTELLDAAHRAATRPAEVTPTGPLGLVPGTGPVPADPPGTGRLPDRHCLPTWDEVAEDVVALYRAALRLAQDSDTDSDTGSDTGSETGTGNASAPVLQEQLVHLVH